VAGAWHQPDLNQAFHPPAGLFNPGGEMFEWENPGSKKRLPGMGIIGPHVKLRCR